MHNNIMTKQIINTAACLLCKALASLCYVTYVIIITYFIIHWTATHDQLKIINITYVIIPRWSLLGIPKHTPQLHWLLSHCIIEHSNQR